MTSTELRVPIAVGLKVTLMMQLAVLARVVPHWFVVAKSPALPPAIPMLLMVRGAVPVLDSVTVWAVAVLPTWMFPNEIATVDTPAIGAVPVPVSDTDKGGEFELAMVIAAVRLPFAVGLNVTLIVQFAPPKRLLVQVLICQKSAAFVPVIVIPLMASVPAPGVLDNVTV
jgi:hypothetical protein